VASGQPRAGPDLALHSFGKLEDESG
jgi:hypothetical protein